MTVMSRWFAATIVLCAISVCYCVSEKPWDRFNLAPSSRTIYPVSVYKTTGSIVDPSAVLTGNPTGIDPGSYITLDFGKEVGGIITLSVHSISGQGVELGLGFSESSLFVGVASDSSANCCNSDGVLLKTFKGKEVWTTPPEYLRGGFKYLTLSNNSTGRINIDRVSLEWTPSPDTKNPRDYPNYFYCSDDY
ncbi:trehalase family glycosidase [Acrasis kona]|uniref:Trehalase family glycosidase n=1 Tax=Acrasis kona TaxID=1008807 RepID=A0AAW2Z8H3_9EUKA